MGADELTKSAMGADELTKSAMGADELTKSRATPSGAAEARPALTPRNAESSSSKIVPTGRDGREEVK
jgi:hypothetical protein